MLYPQRCCWEYNHPDDPGYVERVAKSDYAINRGSRDKSGDRSMLGLAITGTTAATHFPSGHSVPVLLGGILNSPLLTLRMGQRRLSCWARKVSIASWPIYGRPEILKTCILATTPTTAGLEELHILSFRTIKIEIRFSFLAALIPVDVSSRFAMVVRV